MANGVLVSNDMMDINNISIVTNITEAEVFLQTNINVPVEDFLQELLHGWLNKWDNFNDIATDVYEKIKTAQEEVCEKYLNMQCVNENLAEGLQISIECLILNKLHDHIIPLICYCHEEEDRVFYDKCKTLCDLNITAEQLGAPEDHAIPLAAAVVEFASLDTHKSPTEKMNCLGATFDLIYAELKSAMIEILSLSTDENKIPIIENQEIIPILMIVIIRSKSIHIHSNMYYIEKFLWKLQESKHIQNILTIFKTAVVQIESLSDEDLRPSSGKIHKNLDFVEVTSIMAEMESKSENQTNSLLHNHVKRVTDLIFTSTNSTNAK